MNQNFIGLDVHSLTSTFVNVNEKGEMLCQSKMSTTEKNLLNFVRLQNGCKKLAVEETNLSQWLYLLLKGEVDDLIICNPRYITKRSGAKNDFADALHLAQELRGGHLTPVHHEASFMMELRKIVSAYDNLVRDFVRIKNQYKALYRSQGLNTKGNSIYKDEARISEFKTTENQLVATQLMNQLSVLEMSKKDYLNYFEKNMKKHPILKKLDSIPGFDAVRSNIVAAMICSPHRFHHKHKLWAYAMLVRREKTSDGKSYGQEKIHGCSMLKNVFMGAANNVLIGNTSLRKYYDRQRSDGMDHRDAKKNVARRIAAITLAVLKRDKKYDDHYEEKQRRVNLEKTK